MKLPCRFRRKEIRFGTAVRISRHKQVHCRYGVRLAIRSATPAKTAFRQFQDRRRVNELHP
jgi:hypothetical protein